jgi:hypothetical protein
MQVRPFEIEDIAWSVLLAEEAFADFDDGYGQAVAAWAADPTVSGWVAEGPSGPAGFSTSWPSPCALS